MPFDLKESQLVPSSSSGEEGLDLADPGLGVVIPDVDQRPCVGTVEE